MKPGAMPTLPASDISQCPAQAEALVAEALLYCLDRLTDGNRILLLTIAGQCRNYENCRNYEISL
jgi:hypothetical protein